MFAPYAGVVFHTELVESTLARCYYYTDAMSYGRYNGGCGCFAEKSERTCSSQHSPYHNIGPDGKFVDGDSKYATDCLCKSAESVPKEACFWRGAAYNTSHG